MRQFDPEFAEMRFGSGLSPVIAPPRDAQAMLDGLTAPDVIAQDYPIPTFAEFEPRLTEMFGYLQIKRKNRGTELGKQADKSRRLLQKAARQDMVRWLGASMLRRAHTPSGFFERLTYFWGDHFAATGKSGGVRRATSPYIEEAIRPHVTGRFADMLKAAVTHPVMLEFLDQHVSIGPNSRRAERVKRPVGLNENLAREVLELHTLGVGAPYTQDDVTQLAELLTGLSYHPEKGFRFVKAMAEPGAETVMGKTYPDVMSLDPIYEVLDDLAAHPVTAQHLASKLAVHFVSDTPDPALVDHVAARFRDTGGDLMAVYAALLEHPAAWVREGANIKTPVEFVGSAMRALAVPRDKIETLNEGRMRNLILTPMSVMGLTWQKFAGPDGWPEEDENWLSPAGLAGRVQWAMGAPIKMVDDLPDPRAFAGTALGGALTDDVIFAATAAESRAEAIGLVLMAPAFQRR
ncbi:MAG: DUF1800 domain-containing protein [Pseudomonadota bacterium]